MKKANIAIVLLALVAALGLVSSAQAQTMTGKPKLNIAILIFEGVQIIDYTGPYEVLAGGRNNVYTVAEKAGPVTTSGGMRVIPGYTFENQPKPDIIVIPGGGNLETGPKGYGVGPQLNNQNVIKWIQDNARQVRYVMSVCNGAFLLAKAGLLDGLVATTFHGMLEDLKTFAPKTKVVYDQRFVDNGKIITTAGLSSGIDGALHLIERLDGKGWAQITAIKLEYNWQPELNYARAALADMKLPGSIYEPFVNGAEPISITGGREAWEEKWSVSSSSLPAEMLQRINEKWATEARWSKDDAGKTINASMAATTASRWKFTDEQGQAWNGSVSVQPVAAEKNRLLVTLNIARGETNARAQGK
jgi:putative intracellular protease/amidase